MASYKLNVARVRGCPSARTLAQAIEKYGVPETDEFGVLQCTGTEQSVFATIIRRIQAPVPRLDESRREVAPEMVERVVSYPFGLTPSQESLEVYAGSATSVEQVGAFLTGSLALPVQVEPIELDIPAAVNKLTGLVAKFQLVSIRVRDYAHDSYMAGPYAPKFLDTQHGMEFLAEFAESTIGAKIRFQMKTGKATINLTPKAAFTYSCNEEDQPLVQSFLRKLV